MDIEEARIKATEYSDRKGLKLPLSPLGFGQDGYLWATAQSTAVKAFARRVNYDRELGSYQRLFEFEVTRINNFEVPKLIDYTDDLQVIEMTIVSPPFLLDFGKAYLDVPPDHTPETMADWNDTLAELFGDRTAEVKAALRKLESFGIYYLDAKPGNITFE